MAVPAYILKKGRMPGNRSARSPACIMKKFIQNNLSASYLCVFSFDGFSIWERNEENMMIYCKIFK